MGIFPYYADTVVWLHGPVGYDVAGLTPSLVREMRDWEHKRGTLHREGAALVLMNDPESYFASSVLTRSRPAVSGVKKVVTKEMSARTSE
ncbi:hypothetical protein QF015_000008 [Paenarthrobacter sp. TE4293]